MSGDDAEIYIEEMDSPKLFFKQKSGYKSGRVGLIAGGADFPFVKGAYFANFNFTAESNPPLKTKPFEEVPPEGTLMSWSISETIKNNALDGKFRLTEKDRSLKWTDISADGFGFTNFAKAQNSGDTSKKSTAFARTSIISEKEQVKRLMFRYNLQSWVKVYFNGQLLFGAELQQLDTIGEFKELYLPLRKGTNELWIAVTDSDIGGGWGLQAQLEDMKGIQEITTAEKIDFNSQVDASNSCIAAYSLDGKLHIPCISVPVLGSDTTVFYEADMQQQTQPPFFSFGVSAVKPR